MSVRWLLEHCRNREMDREEALRRAHASVMPLPTEHESWLSGARQMDEGLFLGTASSSEGDVVIRLPWGGEFAHWLIQGTTGSGKTVWSTDLLVQLIVRGRGAGCAAGKGDQYQQLLWHLAARAYGMARAERENFRKRIVLVDPFGTHLAPLNLLATHAGVSPETVAYEVALVIAESMEGGLSVHIESLLRHLLLLLIEAKLTLVESVEVLEDVTLRAILVRQSKNPVVKRFFSSENVPEVSRRALVGRLQAILLSESVRLSFGADACIDLRGVLDRGDPLLVNLGPGPGVPEELRHLFAGLVLQHLYQAVFSRGTRRPRGYLFSFDEFHHFAAEGPLARRLGTILASARAFGFFLMLSHHAFAQIPPNLREMILSNSDITALFRTSGRNAEHLGDFLPRIGQDGRDETRRDQFEELQRLPDRDLYWYDRRKRHRAIRIRVQDLHEPQEVAGISTGKLEDFMREEGFDRGGVTVSRTELHRQIEARQRHIDELRRPPVTVSRPPEGPPRAKRAKGGRANLG